MIYLEIAGAVLAAWVVLGIVTVAAFNAAKFLVSRS